jgi:hypothetical protein
MVQRLHHPIVACTFAAPQVVAVVVQVALSVHLESAGTDVLNVIHNIEEHSLGAGRSGEASSIGPSLLPVDPPKELLQIEGQLPRFSIGLVEFGVGVLFLQLVLWVGVDNLGHELIEVFHALHLVLAEEVEIGRDFEQNSGDHVTPLVK